MESLLPLGGRMGADTGGGCHKSVMLPWIDGTRRGEGPLPSSQVGKGPAPGVAGLTVRRGAHFPSSAPAPLGGLTSLTPHGSWSKSQGPFSFFSSIALPDCSGVLELPRV